MPRAARKNYRLPDEHKAIVAAIAEAKGGLTETRVVLNAIELYGRQVLGRRMADLVKVRVERERVARGA